MGCISPTTPTPWMAVAHRVTKIGQMAERDRKKFYGREKQQFKSWECVVLWYNNSPPELFDQVPSFFKLIIPATFQPFYHDAHPLHFRRSSYCCLYCGSFTYQSCLRGEILSVLEFNMTYTIGRATPKSRKLWAHPRSVEPHP